MVVLKLFLSNFKTNQYLFIVLPLQESIEVFHSTGSIDSHQNSPPSSIYNMHKPRGFTDQVADNHVDVFNKTVEAKFMLVIIWKVPVFSY